MLRTVSNLRGIVRAKRAGRVPAWAEYNHRLRRLYYATPAWITDEMVKQMERIYETRPPGHHVDHIVPLDGSLVCGLNVPWNLQHLRKLNNLRKSNRSWPGSPGENQELFETKHHPYQQKLPF